MRIALGWQHGNIVRLVLISGAKQERPSSWWEPRSRRILCAAFPLQVSPSDPAVLVPSAPGVFALALLAAVMPARRTAAVDPTGASRGKQMCLRAQEILFAADEEPRRDARLPTSISLAVRSIWLPRHPV
ncbi:MAG TPA: hypothetical protein VME18_06235 [Acidobacteriaceae bacterium]|nr:hypothetical protein [Acidobacteriaceae bacterium]